MKPLYTPDEFNNTKSQEKLKLECYQCKKTFLKRKANIKQVVDGHRPNSCKYCSVTCSSISHNKGQFYECKNCKKSVYKTPSDINHRSNKTKSAFCGNSCAAIYNNTHKRTGVRVSKLELWLQSQLSILYPELEILYNDKATINSELDIYIPSLKLAFELNGLFHYEPIYGKEKLDQIQNNDNRKFQACLEHGIELCIIDTSKQKYVKESTSKPYLNIIIQILNKRLVALVGYEPTLYGV